MFTWDQEEVGCEMWLVPCRSFPPAQGAAPGTLLGAKVRAGRQELLAPGVGRILPCLQTRLMVLIGHLRALSLELMKTWTGDRWAAHKVASLLLGQLG